MLRVSILPLFLRFFKFNLELFRQCVIWGFSFYYVCLNMIFTITDMSDDNCHNSLNGDNNRTSIEVQNGCRQVRSHNRINIQSSLYIKVTRGNLKMWPL